MILQQPALGVTPQYWLRLLLSRHWPSTLDLSLVLRFLSELSSLSFGSSLPQLLVSRSLLFLEKKERSVTRSNSFEFFAPNLIDLCCKTDCRGFQPEDKRENLKRQLTKLLEEFFESLTL